MIGRIKLDLLKVEGVRFNTDIIECTYHSNFRLEFRYIVRVVKSNISHVIPSDLEDVGIFFVRNSSVERRNFQLEQPLST